MIASYILLSAFLFCTGVYGVLARRNLIMVLLSIEVMINGAALAFAVFARGATVATSTPAVDGHVFVIVALAVAAAEAGVGLAILILLFRNRRSIQSGAAASMWG
jgi:NADH:ubiquinone oxidoreductase subunit K